MPKVTAFEPAMRRALDGVAADLRVFASCGSTNDEAMAWGRDGAPHRAVVATDHQDAGRGRHGRRWEAEPGTALLASIVIRPELAPDRWGLLPLLVGVTVREAIERRTGVVATLKWPNDLLVGGRKLAGILVEASLPAFAVVGIGVNVATQRFRPELYATSLALEGAHRLDRADLLGAIVAGLDGTLGAPMAALERWRHAAGTLGRTVRVTRADGTVLQGRAVGVADTGALEIETDAGLLSLVSGEVEHLRS